MFSYRKILKNGTDRVKEDTSVISAYRDLTGFGIDENVELVGVFSLPVTRESKCCRD